MKQMPYKQWRYEEGMRTGRDQTSIWYRVKNGKYPGLVLRRVNQRVIIVKWKAEGGPAKFKAQQAARVRAAFNETHEVALTTKR